MLVLDTSGKLSDFPIVVAVSKSGRGEIIKRLREKIRKRNAGIAARRRIKSSDLTDEELEWFMDNIDFPFRVVECDSLQYRTYKSLYQQRKKWKFEFLSLLYYAGISGLARDDEDILIDKDYDSKSMEFIISMLKDLLLERNNIQARISFAEKDDAIVVADLIAGAARRGLVSSIKANVVELSAAFIKNKAARRAT